MANAAAFYDRENPHVLTVDEVPDRATCCCYVRDSRGVFMTADAMHDQRSKTMFRALSCSPVAVCR